MLRSISWAQLMEWMAYEKMEPFGDLRRDWQAASICATIANMTAIQMRSEKRFQVKDFMLDFEPRAVAEPESTGKTWQEMRMIAQMMALQSQSKKRR
jgi:hypothetical protein